MQLKTQSLKNVQKCILMICCDISISIKIFENIKYNKKTINVENSWAA